MLEKEKYINLWTKYLPVISLQLKNSKNGVRTIPMNEIEFTSVGDRDNAGYQFNLIIKNGKVTNDISGTAVARDFNKVLNSNPAAKQILKEGTYKLNLNTQFVLTIQKLTE